MKMKKKILKRLNFEFINVLYILSTMKNTTNYYIFSIQYTIKMIFVFKKKARKKRKHNS